MTTLGKKPFEIIVGKGENVSNHFFPQCFSDMSTKNRIIGAALKLSSAKAFSLDKARILSSGKGFILYRIVLWF